MTTKNELIADLLMGAAYADKHLDGRELAVVKTLLAKVMDVEMIDAEMEKHIENFDHEGFNPENAVRSLALATEDEKRHLIELIAAVTEADDVLDLDENEYIENIAKVLDLPRRTFTDLTFEVLSVENLKNAGQKLLSTPPPVPPEAQK